MQDASYIQKIVSGESFEELEKILRGRIIELKETYKIRNYEHAKNLRKDVDSLIEKSEKTARLPEQKERLAKELKKYSILINLGKIFGGPENEYILNKLLENVEKIQCLENKLEEKIIELKEEYILEDPIVTKILRDSVDIKLKEKSYHEHFSDYKKFEDIINSTIRKLEGTFIRKDLFDQLKLLRKNFYKKRKLDEEGIIELRNIIEKAKMSNMGFEDIESSLDLFLKDVLEY